MFILFLLVGIWVFTYAGLVAFACIGGDDLFLTRIPRVDALLGAYRSAFTWEERIHITGLAVVFDLAWPIVLLIAVIMAVKSLIKPVQS